MQCFSLGLTLAALCAFQAFSACASTGRTFKQSAPRQGMFAAAAAPYAKRLTPVQRDEWRFLKDAAAESRFESDASRLALAKSADPNVRSLAATLVNHHASAQPSLQQMLHVRKIAPPMLSNDQRKALDHLAKLRGVKFDRAWLDWVALRSQEQGVQAFERAASSAADPALKHWVERTLPTRRYQLASAERLVAPGPTAAEMAARSMGASAATVSANLAEGNMLLGPARPVAFKVTAPNSR